MSIMFSVFALILVALVSNVFSSLPKLVVLSFQDFHPENYHTSSTPYLLSLFKDASGPAYMDPMFPPTTFATHFTMATGVGPGVHGVYGDTMFDIKGNKIHNTKEQFQTNKSIVPIWIENEKAGNGRHSGVMMWPGSQFEYQGILPTHIQNYDPEMDWSVRAKKIVEWITKSDSKANLVMAYFENSTFCHNKKQHTDYVLTHFKKVDDTIKQIHSALAEAKIDGGFDMIILSDHDTELVTHNHVMTIDQFVTTDDDVKVILSGPLVFIKPTKVNRASVINCIKEKDECFLNFVLFENIDFPLDWEMTSIPSLNDVIILLANSEFTFYEEDRFKQEIDKFKNKEDFQTLEYGYDSKNLNMIGFFLGIGPKFKKNYFSVEHFDLVEVYPLFKFLLKLPDKASETQKNKLNYSVIDLLVEFPSQNCTRDDNQESQDDGEKFDDDDKES